MFFPVATSIILFGNSESIKKFISAAFTMSIWTLLVHLIVSLLIILAIVRWVWKPTAEFVGRREKELDKEHKDLILNNREIKYYLKSLKEEKEKISQIRRKESNEAAKRADQLLLETRKKAELMAKSIEEDAHTRVKVFEEKAKEEIKNSIVQLSIKLTEKLLDANINKKNSKKIIDAYIDELEKSDMSSKKLS